MSARKHGFGGKEKLYSVWSNMRNRCNNPKCKDYKYYGAKGVKVCDVWDDYAAFREWAYFNGYKESCGLSIDRVDTNGDYCPENCRWVDVKTQMNNMSSNHIIEYNGESHSISEWSDIIGIDPRTLEARLVAYKWPVEKALTTPINAHKIVYEYNGESHTLSDWADISGINYHTLYNRINLYGWSFENAIADCEIGGRD